jgi:hypothetical protein
LSASFISYRAQFLAKIDRAFKASVLDVQLEAMANAPVRTGDLRRRIHVAWLGPRRAKVGTDHPGGKMREFGGTIVARRVRFLHFKTRDGHWVKVRQVTQRPGGYSQGFRPWLRPAGRRFGEFMTRHLRERF